MKKKNGFVMTEILLAAGVAILLATGSLCLLSQGLLAYTRYQVALNANELVQTEDAEELALRGLSLREKVLYDAGASKAIYLTEVYDDKTGEVLANKISCK